MRSSALCVTRLPLYSTSPLTSLHEVTLQPLFTRSARQVGTGQQEISDWLRFESIAVKWIKWVKV